MIHLVDVSKSYITERGVKTVIHPTSMSLPAHKKRIAVLGLNGAGKSTFVRLIAGMEEPTTGRILKKCSVSWPLGSGPGVHGKVSGIENIRFITRIYGADFYEAVGFVEEFSELGRALYDPVSTYSAGTRAKFIYSLSLAIDFDCYLLDELVAAGDFRFQKKSREILAKKFDKSGMLFVSHSELKVRQYCNMALVLHNGYLVPFENLDEATEFYLAIKHDSAE